MYQLALIHEYMYHLALSHEYIDAPEYKSRKSKFHFFQEKQKMNSFA